jgi:RNA polymerase sigma-70 factor (ECF subfamily)
MVDADQAIVAAVKAGDTARFRELVDRHKARVYGVLMSLVGDDRLAEELSQETFVKAFTGLFGFREQATFGTWLIQIAIHNARDHRRRAQRWRGRNVVSLEALREANNEALTPRDMTRAADPTSRLEAREERVLVQRALAQLPHEYREVVVLKHLEGWPFDRIAAITGDSVGTLKVRAHRARRMMKEILMELGWEATPTRPSPGAKKETENG